MKKRDITPFGLRLDPEKKVRVKSEAQAHRHSMNTEIDMLIEDGFRWRETQRKQANA